MSNYLFDTLLLNHLNDKRTFLILSDGSTWSYFKILALSGQMASSLDAFGVKPGDRVAVQVEKSPEALALYFACIRVGAVFLPLNTAYTVVELQYFINDASPSVVVCDGRNRQEVSSILERSGTTLLTLNADGSGELIQASRSETVDFETANRSPDDLAAILYTSGTTGRSKGAMLSHANLLSNAQTLAEYWCFNENDVLLHALPIFHTHGLFVATNVSLVANGSMIFLPRFNTKEIIRLLPFATTMMGVPTFYTRLLECKDFTHELVAHMRLFISGSAPLLAETHAAFKTRTGHRILERYGMTETNMNTSNPYDDERRSGTVGFPLPGVDIQICDPETNTELPQGEIGVIQVRGPNVFEGYWGMPEKTAEEFTDQGFFITGDLGLMDSDGYVNIVGRSKDLIISGGFNVYPKEIETEINAIDGVLESAVVGLPHTDFGEGVAAMVVLQSGSELCEENLLAALDGRLARFKQPKRILFIDQLPRNAMGKVQKNILRKEYETLFNEKQA